MKKTYLRNYISSGFTLIELLVVISIVGLLSSVVLASLNSARGKGVDAAIKSNLTGARTLANLYYATTGNNTSYAGVCGNVNGNNISSQVSAAAAKLGAGTAVGTTSAAVFMYSASGGSTPSLSYYAAVCHDVAGGWAAAVSLKSPTTASSGWCVDSTGASKEVTSLTSGDITC